MTKQSQLQYEDIASNLDWETDFAELSPKFMAISADSHVTEPPEAYSRFIDPAFRDVAPRPIPNPDPSIKGDLYWAKGMDPFPFRTTAAAGLNPKDLDLTAGGLDDMHRAGYDSSYRIAAQDRDGILAEVLYPTVGMLLCAHPDSDYKHACFRAYNQWLEEFIQVDPKRLYGVGQSAMRSPKDALEDFRLIAKKGFRAVMLPNWPGDDSDYDDPQWDPVWQCAVELGLPMTFHVLTGKGKNDIMRPPRGGKLAGFGSIIRECQDVAGLFIFGRVFERFPDLKVVLVESDAGWIPHFCSRMDHAYKRHRFWMKAQEMAKLPSEYFFQNVYATFQDDWVALQNLDLLNPRRIMWANDFPHADATWPWSHLLLEHHMKDLTDEQIGWVLRENVKELYGLDVNTDVASLKVPEAAQA